MTMTIRITDEISIEEREIDILVYADIGMEALSYSLAFSRLAPVQCVTLGHPVTTGIQTVDYYISTEALETEASDQHYTERLVRLQHLPIYFYKPKVPQELQDRKHFGLPEDCHVYACLQSLFKFHPRFDEVLGAILRADPGGVLVLSQGRVGHLRNCLRGNKAAKVDRVETHFQQGVDVFYLFFCGNEFLYSLHGVARTFYDFYFTHDGLVPMI